MDNIALPMGKMMKSIVTGPIKATKLYVKSKLTLKKYEKHTGVTPLSKLKKKMYKSDNNFVDMEKEISNPLIKVLQGASSNTTDVYFDANDTPVLSCSYQISQNLVSKNTKLICNMINQKSTIHSDYYYLSCCVKHNVTTDYTESCLTSLLSKVG